MNKLLLIISLLFASWVQGQGINKFVPTRPNPPKLVNDLADVLSPSEESALERKLLAYNDSTSSQVAIVTIRTTGEYDIADVGREIIKEWGVGTKEKNNGVVMLAAIDDRRMDIETGYGMEGVISDNDALAIIDNDITPNFRRGNYYEGFDAAINSIMKVAAGEYQAPIGYKPSISSKGKATFGRIIVGLIILFIILGMFGGRGNRGGGYMSRRGSGWLGPFILGNMLGRSGGGFGGSGGFGGGFGGGGFGGFGGGSGGGGGASGSW
jgi:uncharacterized protein